MSEDTEFLYMSPVLATADIYRDVKWYEEKLGFKCTFGDDGYKKGDQVAYAVVGRQDLYLHLQFQFPDDMTSTDIRFQVKNIKPLFEEFIDSGVVKKEAFKADTPWGTNEFGFFDPSGNRIHFFEDC